MVKVLAIVIVLMVFLGLTYWALVLTPRTIKPQPELDSRSVFEYETSLVPEVNASLPKRLILRRVRDSEWETSGKHTEFITKKYLEPSMAVSYIRSDAYLLKSSDGPANIVIGRIDDTGSGMHGWHVTMVRSGENPISFDRHQRYSVWIDKNFPSGFNEDGVPIPSNSKRWYFAGPADIVAEESYKGYIEPIAGDK